jgi:hypothetical protein
LFPSSADKPSISQENDLSELPEHLRERSKMQRPYHPPKPKVRGKSVKRREKGARMAAMYREFFSLPARLEQIAAHKLTWCIELHPRLVRDTVLGSARV